MRRPYVPAAHERLYEARGVLHCDISDNNVMLRDRGAPPGHRGLLVDLDGAAFVQYDSKSETNLAPISHDVVRWLHCTAQ